MSEVRALLLTDVVDSTAHTERLGDAGAAELWARHDRVARDPPTALARHCCARSPTHGRSGCCAPAPPRLRARQGTGPRPHLARRGRVVTEVRAVATW